MLTEERKKSLQDLEGYFLGEPEFESGLVLRCHNLWTKPLEDFEPNDLRVMIGQGFSLKYLIPMALDLLEQEPLLDAEYYEGDLLTALAQVDPCEIQAHPEWLQRSKQIMNRALKCLKDDDPDLTRTVNAFLARFE